MSCAGISSVADLPHIFWNAMVKRRPIAKPLTHKGVYLRTDSHGLERGADAAALAGGDLAVLPVIRAAILLAGLLPGALLPTGPALAAGRVDPAALSLAWGLPFAGLLL